MLKVTRTQTAAAGVSDPKHLLKLAVQALEAIRSNLGMAAFIDAAKGTGMSHFAYTQFLKEAKEVIE